MIDPKCINSDQRISYSSQGFLIPCCWFHDEEPFFQEKFRVENNDSIEDILLSEEWLDFYRMLQEEPERAPYTCHRKCGVKDAKS